MDEKQKNPNESKKNHNILKIGGIIIAGALLLALIVSMLRPSPSTISGTVNFNGISPEDAQKSTGEIEIMQRERGSSSEFTKTDVKVPFEDKANWAWDGALENTSYDIRADIYYEGKFIKSSDIQTATAPSSGIKLTVNIGIEDIPEAILKETPVSISGTIEINGYIPSGSTVRILGKQSKNTEYIDATSNVIVTDNAEWEWDEAEIGISYDVKAELVNGGQVVGVSKPITMVAPASDEVLKIESKAEAPAQKASISGIVQLKGPVTQGSTILMLQKTSSDTSYTEFDRMPAVNNATWEWEDALSGQTYEITAALQVNEANSATGSVLTVTAPAKEEIVVIDTNLSLDPPTNMPILECGAEDSAGGFNAKLSYMKVDDAKKYHMTVGTSSGGNDIAAETQDATGLNPELKVYVKKDTSYFTRYAYSYCSDCNINDTQNWSGWSPTLGFKCP